MHEFRNNQYNDNKREWINFVKSTVYNLSSYILSQDEEIALVYGLEQNIPVKLNKHVIKTEFDLF